MSLIHTSPPVVNSPSHAVVSSFVRPRSIDWTLLVLMFLSFLLGYVEGGK